MATLHEQSVINYLISEGDFKPIAEVINEHDFMDENYGLFFLAIRELDNEGHPHNIVDVVQYLLDKGKFRPGYQEMLNTIAGLPRQRTGISEIVKTVKKNSLERERIKASERQDWERVSSLTLQIELLGNKTPEPLPIIQEVPVNKNVFPTHALGEYLAPVVKGIQEATMFSETLIAHSALSALISATQGIGTVMTSKIHGYMLLSTAFLLIGRSSEGKGQADKFFFSAIRGCEKERRMEYFEAEKKYTLLLQEYERELKKGIKDEAGDTICPPEPIKPLDPRLVTYSPTVQSIIKAFIDGASSITLTAEDGKSFLGGWSMSLERQEATMAILCKLIDSGSGEKEVASELNKLFSDRAFCMSLGLQPSFWKKLLDDRTMLSQGLMSRMLVCYPESTIGYRPESGNPDDGKLDIVESKIFKFNTRIKELIEFMYDAIVKEDGSLDRLKYKLSAGALKKWATFQNEYQEKLRVRGGEYANQQEMLGKMPLQPVKIATALFIFEQLDVYGNNCWEIEEIPVSYIERGIEIVKFYWHETKWLFQEHEVSTELAQIEKLGNWLRSNPTTVNGEELATNNIFKLRDILMRRPAGIGKRAELMIALEELEKHNQGRLIKSGRSYLFEIFHNVQSELL